MRVSSVQFKTQNYNLKSSKESNNLPTNSQNNFKQSNFISNVYYKPNYNLNFTGYWFEDHYIKQVVKDCKNLKWLDIFEKPDNYVLDFSKITHDNLFVNNKFDLKKLDLKKEIDRKAAYSFFYVQSVLESYTTSWVRRYNKFNVPKFNATYHTLNDPDSAHPIFEKNLESLLNLNRHKSSLDIPVTNPEGTELCGNFTFLDTETTGTKMYGNPDDWDRIVQIGAIQIKDGKIIENSKISQLINPGRPIPEESTAVHGITDEKVKEAPPIEKYLPSFINDYLTKANGPIVVYNMKFDVPLINKSIREYNRFATKELKERPYEKVIDPFIIMQRIHPYVGVKKKLGLQYQMLFLKEMEDAHDALADVRGTADVFKYTIYYLSKFRKDKTVPLTLREVLVFQNGGTVENIVIPKDVEDCNAFVNIKKSYDMKVKKVTNYFNGYCLTEETLEKLAPLIGKENAGELYKEGLLGEEIGLKSGKFPLNPAETQRIKNSEKFEDIEYTILSNFKKVIGFAKLEDFNGKTKDEIEKIIIENSRINYSGIISDFHMKNPNPIDIPTGNDLPDFDISRRVLLEKSA